MESDRAKKQALEQERVELELQQAKAVLYMRVLMSFGVISILIAATMLLMLDRSMNPKSYAMMMVGVFLLLTGLLWQRKNEYDLGKVNDEIQHYRDQEAAGIRTK